MASVLAKELNQQNFQMNICVGWAKFILPYSGKESNLDDLEGVLVDIRLQRASTKNRYSFDAKALIFTRKILTTNLLSKRSKKLLISDSKDHMPFLHAIIFGKINNSNVAREITQKKISAAKSKVNGQINIKESNVSCDY